RRGTYDHRRHLQTSGAARRARSRRYRWLDLYRDRRLAAFASGRQDVKPAPFDYLRAENRGEAVAMLAEHGDMARILAGGQSLIAMLNMRIVSPELLIDISRAADLQSIRRQGDVIEIGAAVTQSQLERWPDLAVQLPLIAQALPHLGHFQTRNKGTVCGS